MDAGANCMNSRQNHWIDHFRDTMSNDVDDFGEPSYPEFRPTPGQWILSVRLTSIFRTGLFALLVVLCDGPGWRAHFRVLDRMHADGFASPFEKIDWSKRRLVTCRTIPQRLYSETSQTRIARLRRCVAWRRLRRKRFDSLCFSDLAKRVALRQGLRRSGCCARPSTRLKTS